MENHDFDPIEAEKRELDILNNKGMEFEVGRRWSSMIGFKKPRKFTIRPLPVGVMDRLTDEYIDLDMDEDLIKEDALLQAKVLVRKHSKCCARIVAIAVLGNSPLFGVLFHFLAAYFYWRIDSRMLWQLTVIINKLSDYGSFINSIRYLSMMRTTRPQTEPDLVEDDPENED